MVDDALSEGPQHVSGDAEAGHAAGIVTMKMQATTPDNKTPTQIGNPSFPTRIPEV